MVTMYGYHLVTHGYLTWLPHGYNRNYHAMVTELFVKTCYYLVSDYKTQQNIIIFGILWAAILVLFLVRIIFISSSFLIPFWKINK